MQTELSEIGPGGQYDGTPREPEGDEGRRIFRLVVVGEPSIEYSLETLRIELSDSPVVLCYDRDASPERKLTMEGLWEASQNQVRKAVRGLQVFRKYVQKQRGGRPSKHRLSRQEDEDIVVDWETTSAAWAQIEDAEEPFTKEEFCQARGITVEKLERAQRLAREAERSEKSP